MTKVAAIGECMIELSERADGSIARSWGGDTLNTAVYMVRLGMEVDYVTALGDDGWSDEMVAGWRAEGIGTRLVQRLPDRLPGLYYIQTDARGERRFSYWRDGAPARALFELPSTPHIGEALKSYDLIYLSGISLSLYGTRGRERLFDCLRSARQCGARIAFDTNFRPRGWPDLDQARAAYQTAVVCADVILASVEDVELLYSADAQSEIRRWIRGTELVLKLADPTCQVYCHGTEIRIAAKPVAGVVDTTAAGDSFAAAYLAARLAGSEPAEAARAGHRLAGEVVRHRGAIIPRTVMPLNVLSALNNTRRIPDDIPADAPPE